ncbi:MAG: hypothetical protein ABSA01_00480 [Anaerolineales bacterium]|jgi:hypothetical protein
MEFDQQGVHIRMISGLSSRHLVGATGLIKSLNFHTEIKTTRKTLPLGHPTSPSLGVVLNGEGATLEWAGRATPLQRWSWFYLPAGCPANLDSREGSLSLLLTKPVSINPAMLEAALQGEPVVASLNTLRVIRKEGRITFNAAGDGCPINRPFFMASFCIYDQEYGSMAQHVHTDQEECMFVLRATGSQPIFRFSSHSVNLQDETLIHVFPGDYHGFIPSADGKIAIVALYLFPSSNAGVKLEPMSPKDITLWEAVAGS